jgi:PAS domain S-box-containing protein
MPTAAQSAEARTALLASIVDCSADAIIVKTREGTVTNWNRGADRIYGYSAEEMTGQPVITVIAPVSDWRS